MADMEEQIGSILGNPEMMQKIMAMAQALNNSQPQKEAPKESPQSSPIPELDPGMLQKISGIAKHSGIDKEQQNLLRALHPYLSRDRIHKLENAMRAAKMAKFAAAALSTQGAKLPFSR